MRDDSASIGWAARGTFVAVFLAAVPRAAAAAGGAELDVRVDSTTCQTSLVEETQRLTLVELNSSRLALGADAPRVFLSCRESVVLIRVSLGEQVDTRQLDLEQTDSALRPRVLALASAELVRDMAGSEPPPAPPAPPPVPPIEQHREPSWRSSASAAPPREEAENRLSLFTESNNFGSHFQPLVGGGLGFSHGVRRLTLSMGSAFSTSDRRTSLGSVRVLAGDLSAKIAVHFPNRLMPSELGVGYALGYARIHAHGSSTEATPGQVQGVWAGPFLFGALESPLFSRLFLQLVAQAGFVTLPVRGRVAQSRDSELAGVWLGLSLGFGWKL